MHGPARSPRRDGAEPDVSRARGAAEPQARPSEFRCADSVLVRLSRRVHTGPPRPRVRP